ncbi:Sin3 histone deacetylase corepressor complex component SDS3 [Taenia crassiceps]|uniref:Sin3 histone deacetylase corepressor complex component SDS3 n=1 Tax=Taenia crassiceps TaxID=6207 RepID=A0ABR4QLV2_9CEST
MSGTSRGRTLGHKICIISWVLDTSALCGRCGDRFLRDLPGLDVTCIQFSSRMLIKSANRLNSHSKRERENGDPSGDSHKEGGDVFDPEKEYLEKLEAFATQLKQLNERAHPEFCKSSKRIENWLADQKLRNQILHDYKIDEIHSQYEREIRTCDRDCATEKKKIQEYLIGLCEDLKRRLEHDKKCIELTTTGDVLELKPTVTRKLRRRAPEVPSSIVGSGIVSGVAGKFGYWGDLHLYSPTCGTGQENVEDAVCHAVAPPPSTFASISASNAAGNGHGDSGVLSTSGVLFTQSALASTLGCIGNTGSNSSAVTSVAAVMVPGLTGLAGAQPPKRRKQQNNQPLTQLSLLLPENDIYSDLTLIHRTCGKPPSSGGMKKHCHEAGVGTGGTVRGVAGANSPLVVGARSEETHSRRRSGNTDSGRREQHHHHHHHHTHHHDSGSRESGSNSPLIWIDDGRLYIGQSCYQQGTPVYLESHGCNGTVVAVGAQDVSIKRSSDTGIMRITVQQLKLGRYVLAPLQSRQTSAVTMLVLIS